MFEVVTDLGFNGKYDIFHNTDALDMFDNVKFVICFKEEK